MTLRRKLLTVFVGLGAIALLTAGLTLWVTARWSYTSGQMEAHYRRSLLLQRVRAATYQALKEIPDAAFLRDKDARGEFAEAIKPAQDDLASWVELADTVDERAEIERVGSAFRLVLGEAERAFELLGRDDRAGAASALEDGLEGSVKAFQKVTGAAVERDQARRGEVRAAVDEIKRTAFVILSIASFGTLSLVLLLAAYLASDLFRPLRDVARALDGLGHGELGARLDEEREDEIGALQQAFNRAAAALERRERASTLASSFTSGLGARVEDDEAGAWHTRPSRMLLHGLVARLKDRLTIVRAGIADGGVEGKEGDQDDGVAMKALCDAEDLLSGIARFAAFGFPLDLDVAPTDVGALIHDVLARFRDELIRQGVSYEVVLDPMLGVVVLDRLKMREAMSEVIRNGLAALPERGGRLGIRSNLFGQDGSSVLAIEVADNGAGIAPEAVGRVLGDDPFRIDHGDPLPKIGLALTKAIVERHGGDLNVMSRPGVGTVVRLTLPQAS